MAKEQSEHMLCVELCKTIQWQQPQSVSLRSYASRIGKAEGVFNLHHLDL